MNLQDKDLSENKKASRGGMVTGILLITVGLGWLLFQLIDRSGLFPLLLGAGFLVGGCITRKPGLIIPGGIVGGVGLGILAIESNFLGAGGASAGGAFMVAFSLGWFSIPLLTRLFAGATEWWAFIPGSIIGLIGVLILAGEQGLIILQWIGEFWPISLVIVGGIILIQYFRQK